MLPNDLTGPDAPKYDTQPASTGTCSLESKSLHPNLQQNVISVWNMSAFIREETSADIIKDPTHQDFQQGLFERCTSLLGHEIWCYFERTFGFPELSHRDAVQTSLRLPQFPIRDVRL